DAAEIVRGVGELYEPLADVKGLAIKIDAASPAPVKGNRELVSQAVANLVDNAIKYAKPAAVDGANTEGLISARSEGHPLLLSVADHGPGIPRQDRRRGVG